MARTIANTDIEKREAMRRAFVNGGAKHPYAVEGATKEETPQTNVEAKTAAVKKPVIPRKREEDKFQKEQIRMHPSLSRAIEDFAQREGMIFAEAARELIRAGLKYHSLKL